MPHPNPVRSPMPSALPTARPARPPARPARDASADVAALYPQDLPAAQALLARGAVDALATAGVPAHLGSYGDHATCQTPTGLGSTLVLVPMALLYDLDPALAAEDDADPAVWHLMALDGRGRWVDDPVPVWSCPSVLWAVRAGIDPACAVDLVATALADPYLRPLLAAAGGLR